MLKYNLEKEHTGGGCWMHWLTFESEITIGVSNVDYVIVVPPKGVGYTSPEWENEWYEENGINFLTYDWQTENINDPLTEFGCSEEEIMTITDYCFKSETDPAFRWAW